MEFRRLSAPGEAALSLWRLQAPPELLAELLGALPEPGRPRLLAVGPRAASFDRGLCVLVDPGPPAAVELQLHGGYGVARALRTWLSAAGLVETAAPADRDRDGLERARSPRAAAAWAALQGGSFEREMQRLEELPAAERAAAQARLQSRLGWAEVLEEPPLLVLAGPPNVGKSTLLNTWLRRPRATVSPLAGTTRDEVMALATVGSGADAWALRLVDTAGLWPAATGIDREAVARTDELLAAAWQVLWVFDAAAPPADDVADLVAARMRPGHLRLLHRADLGVAWEPASRFGGSWLQGSAQVAPAALLADLEAALEAPLGPPPAAGELLPLGAARRRALAATGRMGGKR